MKKVLFIMTFILLFSPQVKAVSIPVDCSCAEIKVYGDEQVDEDNCAVEVNIKPILSREDQEKAKKEAQQIRDQKTIKTIEEQELQQDIVKAGENFIEGIAVLYEGSIKSLLSPFFAIWQQIPIKKTLLIHVPWLVNTHSSAYHDFLDKEVFGKAIAQISSHKKAEDLQKYLQELDDQQKQDEKKGKKECTDSKSPLPNCVARRAMCSHEKYIGALFEQSGMTLANSLGNSLDEAVDDWAVMSKILEKRDQALLEEAVNARQALDTAVLVYTQFFSTYQLHLRFKEIINSLTKARDITAFFRTLVECVPNKFVGVQTTQCN